MPIVNADVAAVFNEIADLLEVQGANAFRVRAYRNAARMLSELGRSVKTLVDRGEDLDALPGIGQDLAGKITEIVATGTCAQLERLRKELPPAITELLKIPGLGPKRVRALHQELGIQTLEQLHRAAEQGHVRAVHGFGPKTQQHILQATAARLQQGHRFKLLMAAQVAEALLAELAAVPGVQQAVAAGSLRRQRETVGDLDLLVTTQRGSPVMDSFTASPDVREVLSKGSTRASVVLRNGLQVDLRAVAPASFGAAWLYFTGSKAHNIALRKLAQDAGLKLNEYGLYRGDERIAGDTEASVYQALGLPFMAPELREDRGEIDAARAHRLPMLVQLPDLRGDLHAHTRESDGHDSLEAMAEAARARGLQYLAITDHSQRLALVHGLDADRLARQIDRIDELNAGLSGIVLLKGVEVDILEDGTLDLPDAVLQRLDLVVGAVHHRFDLPRDRQTERLLRAMDRPCFSILAHPTGRLIDERPASDIDLPRVIRKARERGCFLELNAHPARLDLTDLACRMAKDEGVLVSIASDAHSTLELDNLRFGIGQARRGWLASPDVLNTRTLQALRPLLDRTMSRGARIREHAASGQQALATPSTP
ncbi:MAG: DNA polymerase/3'-5' exonuclease PolX [Polaromonas sp.]|jgi:DNA polymerase (family 10)|uniref:DNA polymerase/3'-5' exonuclease PolX n=1 Tax=Polaromonas sp. TaxID=1869339 RepID=UPI0027303667|nr:DNA polymerase/3'-5' exonuclease PolX [Polaromonas sp.]MDP2255226.1 DNA polymerase/3'-5' exonuclease PolX [Polaromonas sp.]